MGIRERKDREKKELRKRIMEATAEILIKEGYERTTIRKVASAIEYSPRTVYLYFKDKDALLMEIIEEGFASTLEKRKAMYNQPDYSRPEEIFVPQILGNIQKALDAPNLYRAIVYLIQYKASPTGPYQQAVIDAVESDLKGCYAHFSYPADDTAQKADMILAFMRGFNLMLINRAEQLSDKEIEKYKQLCVRSILDGIVGIKADQ
jgi:AcrR family transcriptional regulator